MTRESLTKSVCVCDDLVMTEQNENQLIEEVMLGNRKERVKAEMEKADKAFDDFLVKEYGGEENDPHSAYIDEKLEVCFGDPEFDELVDRFWEDTMSDEIALVEREEVLIEEKGSERLKEAHKLARTSLVARVKYHTIFGGDWWFGDDFPEKRSENRFPDEDESLVDPLTDVLNRQG